MSSVRLSGTAVSGGMTGLTEILRIAGKDSRQFRLTNWSGRRLPIFSHNPGRTQMSVLVEAVCVIIQRKRLDQTYPGGTDAFLAHSDRRSAEHRYVCMDDHLVCLSYFSPDAADRGIVPLIREGLTETDDDGFVDFAVVDQRYGPSLPCAWLSWSRDPSGYGCAWLAGELPGELSAPEGWTVSSSLRLKGIDIRNFPDRALKLADENGVETWLDFDTGRITRVAGRESFNS